MLISTPIIEIIRLEEDHDSGTFGVMKIQKKIFCVTLEPADLENKRNVSSIPAQQYICVRRASRRFGLTFEVSNVPDRSDILFHAGNRKRDTAGCILLAASFPKLQGDRAVMNSGETFRRFIKMMGNTVEFHLTINEVF